MQMELTDIVDPMNSHTSSLTCVGSSEDPNGYQRNNEYSYTIENLKAATYRVRIQIEKMGGFTEILNFDNDILIEEHPPEVPIIEDYKIKTQDSDFYDESDPDLDDPNGIIGFEIERDLTETKEVDLKLSVHDGVENEEELFTLKPGEEQTINIQMNNLTAHNYDIKLEIQDTAGN